MTKPAISAGTYIRRRREAAPLSLREAAKLFAGTRLHADACERMLAGVELDARVLDAPELVRLRAIFRFDPQIYANLVARLPTPSLCRECACSWHDPCLIGGPCAWADDAATICSRCAQAKAA